MRFSFSEKFIFGLTSFLLLFQLSRYTKDTQRGGYRNETTNPLLDCKNCSNAGKSLPIRMPFSFVWVQQFRIICPHNFCIVIFIKNRRIMFSENYNNTMEELLCWHCFTSENLRIISVISAVRYTVVEKLEMHDCICPMNVKCSNISSNIWDCCSMKAAAWKFHHPLQAFCKHTISSQL